MHFLIDADLPRSVGDLLRSYGHEAFDVRDMGMRTALDATIAQHAQREGWCLLTTEGPKLYQRYEDENFGRICPRRCISMVMSGALSEFP